VYFEKMLQDLQIKMDLSFCCLPQRISKYAGGLIHYILAVYPQQR